MASSPHVGDVGTVIEVQVVSTDPDTGVTAPVDLSAATGLQLVFLKPDQTRVAQTATLWGTGTDGKIKYVTVPGDLDQSGTWKVQAVVAVGGSVYHTDIAPLKVLPSL
jgi:hypothetical protein